MKPANYWIESLHLMPHPEGGYFSETYRSVESITQNGLPDRFPGPRSISTAIYFLLEKNQFSALHRIRSDEIWHFYAGDSLQVHIIELNGDYTLKRLGKDPGNGESFQVTVSAGCWFGATVAVPGAYALVGCTVAPGFDFADFELANRQNLIQTFPFHKDLIESLTSPS